MEPITIFSRIADVAGVARRLRELSPNVQIDGPDDDWQNAVVTFPKGKTKQLTLTLTHDPEYYAEPSWSEQMAGMRGYFSRFPNTPNKSRVMGLTTTFRFSLGTLCEPDFDPNGDPRLDIIFAITELLDGVLFTPTSMRDAHGRILYSSEGVIAENADAKWPRVMSEVSINTPMGHIMHELSRPIDPNEEVQDWMNPPSPERVARRALALVAVTVRAILEQEGDNPDARDTHQAVIKWVHQIGIREEFESEEWMALQTPLGKLSQRVQLDTTWRLEGLVVLAWALGKFEIPLHDEVVKFNPVWRNLGFLDDEVAKELLANPTLRPRTEIGTMRNRFFSLHWRLRDFYINTSTMDFAKFAETCTFGPLDITGLPLIKGDLALQGERLDEAPDEIVSLAQSIIHERHKAINWLWEGPEVYSEASVAT